MNKIAIMLILVTIIHSTPVWAAPIEVKQKQQLLKSKLPQNAVRVPFLRIQLGTTEGTQNLKSLTIGRTGLSSSEDLGRIWAETDNYRRSNSRQLNNDDTVVLEFKNPIVIEANQPEWITIYANMNAESGNRTIGLSLLGINSQDPVSAKAETKISTPKIKTRRQTTSKAPYDRSKYRIKCVNSRCQLVPRN